MKITEGSEPPEFWDSIGGKTEYASGKWLEEVTPSHPPRLFQCSNASGHFRVEEIFDFAQEVYPAHTPTACYLLLPFSLPALPPSLPSLSSLSPQDLIEEDVMILDTFDQVFVWIGRGANEVEKKEALKTAKDYIQSDPSNRDLDSTLLIQVCALIKRFPFCSIEVV